MILIDTDHATQLKYPNSDRSRRLIQKLEALPGTEAVGVSIVTVEERMRGWLSVIAKEKSSSRQVFAYRELAGLFDFYSEFAIVHFDDVAARHFDELRRQKIRIGTLDLRIACTALAQGALLLSANLVDFNQVPGLRVENWLT